MKRFLLHIILVCTLVLWAGPHGKLLAQQYNETEVKAAFLCNFSKFVYWPENAFGTDTSSLVIGIIGEDPFGFTLDKIARNVTIEKRKLLVRRLKNMSEAGACHILYVGSMPGTDIGNLLSNQLKTPVLTVSDSPGFCQSGGMINFSKQRAKFGFEINPGQVKKASLDISSKLLNLAIIVE